MTVNRPSSDTRVIHDFIPRVIGGPGLNAAYSQSQAPASALP